MMHQRAEGVRRRVRGGVLHLFQCTAQDLPTLPCRHMQPFEVDSLQVKGFSIRRATTSFYRGDMPQDAATTDQEALLESGRKELKDKAVREDMIGGRWSNILFVRLVAKGRLFKNVNFKYSIFDNCYLRDSTFEDCDFTGCKFVSTNMHGARFIGCKFEYVLFERTIVDISILEEGCPGQENLRMRFARSLRLNYHQIGDARAANKAIAVELEAMGSHLWKAWNSKESYYRKKYRGLTRLKMFAEWFTFSTLDFIWGNGEDVFKLFRFCAIILIFIMILDLGASIGVDSPISTLDAAQRAPQIFFGVLTPKDLSRNWLTIIVVLRLVTFGFFMSIIIKRFNRR